MPDLKKIHPENREEFAYRDFLNVQKDLTMYLSDLDDQEITDLCNHFASNQCSLDPEWKQPNVLREWLKNTYSYKYSHGLLK